MLSTVHPESKQVFANHRGSVAGFVRVSSDRLRLYLPDYSGNRFYGSLGNIFSTGVASLTFTDYTNGNLLCVSGTARVVAGEDALALMPRVMMLVELTVIRYTYTMNSHALR